jgi:hypothetical protein
MDFESSRLLQHSFDNEKFWCQLINVHCHAWLAAPPQESFLLASLTFTTIYEPSPKPNSAITKVG